jgi:hypothetical protein
MKYIESCFLPLKSVQDNVSEKIYCNFENIFLLQNSTDITNNIFIKNFNNIDSEYVLCKTSFHHSIKNKLSLERLIINTPINDMDFIYKKLGNLFYSLQIMGRYGFCHNDAHLQNILLDDDTEELVLIDYGKSFFNDNLIRTKINNVDIEKQIFYERGKYNNFNDNICNIINKNNNYDSYDSYISNFYNTNYAACGLRDYIINPPIFNKENLFMFDIMTITLGVINMNKSQEIQSVYSRSGKSLLLMNRKLIILTMDSMTTPQDIRDNPWIILLPGLFWFSLFNDFIKVFSRDRTFDITSQQNHMFPNINTLFSRESPIYTSFQLLNILDSDKFDNFCKDYCKEDIDYVLDFFGKYKNAFSSQKAGKNKKMNKNIPKNKNTLKKEMKKVPQSTFKDYMGGYTGPDSQSSISNAIPQTKPQTSHSPFRTYMDGYTGPNSSMSISKLRKSKLPVKTPKQTQTK